VGDIMSESMGGIISECPGDFIGIGSPPVTRHDKSISVLIDTLEKAFA
jgi:hypothetical protein